MFTKKELCACKGISENKVRSGTAIFLTFQGWQNSWGSEQEQLSPIPNGKLLYEKKRERHQSKLWYWCYWIFYRHHKTPLLFRLLPVPKYLTSFLVAELRPCQSPRPLASLEAEKPSLPSRMFTHSIVYWNNKSLMFHIENYSWCLIIHSDWL